jgi:hypothetical protein
MLKVTHGVGIGRIRKQDVAVWRAAGHRAKIECHRIRAAAVHDVARVNDQAVLSHGDREIAPATERLADGGHALQQRLVFEQGYERNRWSVELIEATNGARSAEGWAARLSGSLAHLTARGLVAPTQIGLLHSLQHPLVKMNGEGEFSGPVVRVLTSTVQFLDMVAASCSSELAVHLVGRHHGKQVGGRMYLDHVAPAF